MKTDNRWWRRVETVGATGGRRAAAAWKLYIFTPYCYAHTHTHTLAGGVFTLLSVRRCARIQEDSVASSVSP